MSLDFSVYVPRFLPYLGTDILASRDIHITMYRDIHQSTKEANNDKRS